MRKKGQPGCPCCSVTPNIRFRILRYKCSEKTPVCDATVTIENRTTGDIYLSSGITDEFGYTPLFYIPPGVNPNDILRVTAIYSSKTKVRDPAFLPQTPSDDDWIEFRIGSPIGYQLRPFEVILWGDWPYLPGGFGDPPPLDRAQRVDNLYCTDTTQDGPGGEYKCDANKAWAPISRNLLFTDILFGLEVDLEWENRIFWPSGMEPHGFANPCTGLGTYGFWYGEATIPAYGLIAGGVEFLEATPPVSYMDTYDWCTDLLIPRHPPLIGTTNIFKQVSPQPFFLKVRFYLTWAGLYVGYPSCYGRFPGAFGNPVSITVESCLWPVLIPDDSLDQDVLKKQLASNLSGLGSDYTPGWSITSDGGFDTTIPGYDVTCRREDPTTFVGVWGSKSLMLFYPGDWCGPNPPPTPPGFPTTCPCPMGLFADFNEFHYKYRSLFMISEV